MKTRNSGKTITLAELAEQTGADLDGDGSVLISGVAPIEQAQPGSITFVAKSTFERHIAATKASAIVLTPKTEAGAIPVLRHKNPYLIFARIIDLLYPLPRRVAPGLDGSSTIHDTARIDATAGIGPQCILAEKVSVGANSQLMAQVYLGQGAAIGEDCLIYPGVKIMEGCQVGNRVILHAGVVIGSDGFGFAESDTGLKKIQQIGWVEVGDDVEIGANTTVDRGAIGPTKIGQGTKIDNLVQIAHNVDIGRHSIIVSQVGISGSTKIGNGVVLAGQAGIVGHIEIGDGVIIGAQSGITKSVKPGVTMFGSPAREIMETKRIEASMRRLPDLLKRVKKLEDDRG